MPVIDFFLRRGFPVAQITDAGKNAGAAITTVAVATVAPVATETVAPVVTQAATTVKDHATDAATTAKDLATGAAGAGKSASEMMDWYNDLKNWPANHRGLIIGICVCLALFGALLLWCCFMQCWGMVRPCFKLCGCCCSACLDAKDKEHGVGRHAKRDRKGSSKRSQRSRGRGSDDEDDDDEYDPEDGREQDVRPRRSESKGRSSSRSPRAEMSDDESDDDLDPQPPKKPEMAQVKP